MPTLLFELVKDLGPAEKRELQNWLASPIHNKKQAILDLFNAYVAAEEEGKQVLWWQLYPDRPFNQTAWDLLKRELLFCLEEYLSYQQYQAFVPRQAMGYGLPQLGSKRKKVSRRNKGRNFSSELLLIEAYGQKGLWRHRQQRIDRAEKRLKQLPSLDLAERCRLFAANEVYQESLAAHHLLDIALVRTKLRAACQTLSSLQLLKLPLEVPLLEECLDLAGKAPFNSRLDIKPYRLACLLLLEPEQAAFHFESLLEICTQQLDYYGPEEQRDLLRIGLNYCVGRINVGDDSYLEAGLQLYRELLDRNLAYEGRHISPFTFNNIVGIALRLGEYDWTAAFIDREQSQLPIEEQTSLSALNSARLALAREDYNGVLIALRTVDFQDFIHQLLARILQLKAYRALSLFDLAATHTQNTRVMLRRKKTKSYHVTNYRNIFDLAHQLTRLPPGDKRALEELRQLIERTEPLTERSWLLKELLK